MTGTAAAVEQRIRDRLAALAPESLELQDESGLHVGHPGAASGGGHYRLVVVSAAFVGLNTLARHRLVYDALGDLMHGEIHALGIHALTPDEL
jgi:BolA protein